MATLNRALLIGNLTRDPELRYLPNGTAICELSLAVNSKRKDKASGEYIEEVSFFDILAWAKTGENCAQYLKKGRPCLVEGHLKQDRWEDKTSGQKRSKVVIVAENVQFLGGRQQEEDDATPGTLAGESGASAKPTQTKADDGAGF
jgi:single-strand DNA-binding protein